MRAPEVVLADGDEASGLASMLAGVLSDNLRDYPARARVASIARGDVVLTASDRDVSVTLRFGPGRVVIENGGTRGAPVLAGPWLEMAKLCSGQGSPVAALRDRTVKVTPGRSPAALAAAVYALTVPASFYDDDEERAAREERRRRATRIAVLVAVLLLLGVALRRRRRCSHCRRCRNRRRDR